MSRLRSRVFGAALAAAAILSVPQVVSAGSIVTYFLGGVSDSNPIVQPTFSASGVAGLPIERIGALTAAPGLTEGYFSQGWDNSNAAVTLGFRVTGSPVDVSELKFGSRSTATGPGSIDVLFSVDGGAFVKEATISQPPPSATNPIFGGYIDTDLTFATPIVVTQSLKIEFIVSPNAMAANGGTIDASGAWGLKDFIPNYIPGGDNTFQPFQINSVPEPSSVILTGIALAGLAVAARARRKQSA
jgi:PEP-CTERM motif